LDPRYEWTSLVIEGKRKAEAAARGDRAGQRKTELKDARAKPDDAVKDGNAQRFRRAGAQRAGAGAHRRNCQVGEELDLPALARNDPIYAPFRSLARRFGRKVAPANDAGMWCGCLVKVAFKKGQGNAAMQPWASPTPTRRTASCASG